MEGDGLWRLFWSTGLPEAYLMARQRPEAGDLHPPEGPPEGPADPAAVQEGGS